MSGSAISRRLMLALFAVTIVPILGWSVVVDVSEHAARRASDGLEISPSNELEQHVVTAKRRLIAVLGLSLATLAGALLYLRRVLVAPLESLADRARRASAAWATPPECAREDEIGDLARALDSSVRELEDRAEKARRFAADLSHELRTPLAAIQGAAELLVQDDLASVDVRRFNQNIVRESQRLGRLAEGILELERGRSLAKWSGEACELHASIREVVESLTLLATRKELRFELALPQERAWTRVDADRHDRVLYALLENALKFSPAGEVIAISLTREETSYRIVIADRGPGVAPSERVAIFERHARASPPTTQRGTGLGLAIAKALVESWGGHVAVRERSGGGASFHYDVPFCEGVEGPATAGEDAQRAGARAT